MLRGKWTYRSYCNAAALVGDDAQAALALIAGEGVLDLDVADGERFRGAFGMSSGYGLTLQGRILPGDGSAFAIVGLGVDGTPTEGWRWELRGWTGYQWPDGVDQVPCLLGTVIRVDAHGASVASFIAVRHSDDPAPRSLRQSSLTRGL